MAAGLWILQRCVADRFPFRLQILRGDAPFLTLRVQDRWPAANRNIFCLREKDAPDDSEILEEIERVPIVALQRRGLRLSVILDRSRYKRCDFLFLTKMTKGSPAREYEQIYWQTQRSMVQRRPRVSMVSQRGPRGYTVRIASEEKYPWSFPGATVQRARLPAGDYALVDGDRLVAVIERKTLDNLLADFGIMPVLRQRLLELGTYEHHALVIEAPYEDFLNANKIHHYSPAYCARLIASLYADFPSLRIVFCANRKTANEWTRNYFAALWGREQPSAD